MSNINMNIEKRPFNKLIPVPFDQVEITDKFWSDWQKTNREVSIPLILEKLEKDHHVDNFRVAAGIKTGVQTGAFYFDSDLYKWLEGACYILHLNRDPKLEERVNAIVDLIAKAQTKDGYINTYFSTKFIQKRFTNLFIFHEDYCAGHLLEAAVAHYNATGNETLLKVAQKFANLLAKIFLGGKKKGAPGHEEIELALIKLYRITSNNKYLELAQDYIERRGRIPNYKTYMMNQSIDWALTNKLANKVNEKYEKERLEAGDTIEEEDEDVQFLTTLTMLDWITFIQENINSKVYQLNTLVRNAKEPVGHAVRAMYLYCAMADVYSETGDKAILKALETIWLKMVKARMYITGGVGSVRGSEGFGKDFNLKNEKSYSETCAAIGNILWNWRMLNITGKCKYADLIEKLLYNALLVGRSIDGKKYFYSNKLISNGNYERQEWFKCACCPTNVVRIIPSLGQYIYSVSENGIFVNQYIGNNAKIELANNAIEINLNSEFPWEGKAKITLKLNRTLKFSIFLRIPGWCRETELQINDKKYESPLISGLYIEILRNWIDDDSITLNFKMEAKFLESDPRIKYNNGKSVISRGPLIYCLEQKDNKDFDIFEAIVPKDQDLQAIDKPDLLEGIKIVQGTTSIGKIFTAIPYYAWNNRGPDKMQVWTKFRN